MSSINAAALLTVLPHVCTSEGRPILNGFFLRRDGVAIGTDGHSLAAHYAAHTVEQDVILRPTKELIALAKKAAKAKTETPLMTAIASDGKTATVTACGMSLEVAVVEGPFPNISQVFPKEFKPITAIRLNQELLAKFPNFTTLAFSGDRRAILVRDADNENFIGLLMPVGMPERNTGKTKGDKTEDEPKPEPAPAWITEPAVAKVAIAA